jgi:hypothetical protein
LQQGARLNQIRFVRGNPPASDIKLGQLDQSEPLVYLEADGPHAAVIKDGLWISVDLEGNADNGIVGYRAKNHAPLVDLSKIAYYDTLEFWEPITRADGKRQWTYKGYALYRFNGDSKAGEHLGQAVYSFENPEGDAVHLRRVAFLEEVGKAVAAAGIYWNIAKP